MPNNGFPKLTPQERLLVDRRRRGETQRQAASRLAVSLNQYSLWERGLASAIPFVPVGRVKPHEHCFLARRRHGVSQEEVASSLGCCRYWVVLMEKGESDCKSLAEYWVQHDNKA